MSDAAAPRYWMHETSGVLRPAIEAYLAGQPMTPEHIAAMRAYLRQWMVGFPEPECDGLRAGVEALTNRPAIDNWLTEAEALGIDPL